MHWLIANKTWILSGIGPFILGLFLYKRANNISGLIKVRNIQKNKNGGDNNITNNI